MPFEEAVRYGALLRLSIDGPTGGGKTFTALRLARELIKRRYKGEGRIAVIDTEKASAKKYALRPGEVEDVRKGKFSFLWMGLSDYHPQRYIDAIHDAEATPGVKVLVIDSLTHAWAGSGGALEIHDNLTKRSGNSYTAWGDVTVLQNKLIDTITSSPLEIIVTLRSKMAHAIEEYEDRGQKKTKVTKLGMAPIQRDGVEYEFDIVIDMDVAHAGFISKTRCVEIDGKVYNPPDETLVGILVDWLDGPEAPPPPPAAPEPERINQMGLYDGLPAFMAALKEASFTTDDITRVVAMANGQLKASDFTRWLQANPDRTLSDLMDQIQAAKVGACVHEPIFNEERALNVCGKCGVPLEGPPPATTGQPSLLQGATA